RAALVGVSLDDERVLRIGAQPLRLLLERADGLLRELGRIGFEEHTIADVDHEILLAAGSCSARIRERRIVCVHCPVPGAAAKRQHCCQNADELHRTHRAHRTKGIGTKGIGRKGIALHSGASSFSLLCRAYPTLAGAWLSEGSVNLDGALREWRKSEDGPETPCGS